VLSGVKVVRVKKVFNKAPDSGALSLVRVIFTVLGGNSRAWVELSFLHLAEEGLIYD